MHTLTYLLGFLFYFAQLQGLVHDLAQHIHKLSHATGNRMSGSTGFLRFASHGNRLCVNGESQYYSSYTFPPGTNAVENNRCSMQTTAGHLSWLIKLWREQKTTLHSIMTHLCALWVEWEGRKRHWFHCACSWHSRIGFSSDDTLPANSTQENSLYPSGTNGFESSVVWSSTLKTQLLVLQSPLRFK